MVIQVSRDPMQDRVMGVIIVDQLVVPTFSTHPEDRAEMLTFKDHNKDQGVIQSSVIHQEAQTHGNRIIELQGIQVLVYPQEVLILVNPPAIDLAYNDRPADPAVRIHPIRKNQTIAAEEDIDLPLISPFIN